MLPFAIMFAQSIPDISRKLSLLDMAGRWPALADEAEKSEATPSWSMRPQPRHTAAKYAS